MIPAASVHLIILTWGLMYPGYQSYKTICSGNKCEYVKWMVYWTVFSSFLTVVTVTDLLIWWFPLYYEFKMLFVLWLLAPYTKGVRILYRKILHPMLARYRHKIEEYANCMMLKSYEFFLGFIQSFLMQVAQLLINMIRDYF